MVRFWIALVVVALVLLCLFFWRRTRSAAPVASPDPADGGFEDIAFSIVGNETLPDESRKLRLQSREESSLKLEIVLGRTWSKGKLQNTDIEVFQGIVTFLPQTAGSMSFASVLDARYRTGLRPDASHGPTLFTAISLEGNPGNLESRPTKIKLFYEPDSEDAYAEVFLDIDLVQGHAEFAEKDQDYRKNLVRAFSAR